MLGIKAKETGKHYSKIDPESYKTVAQQVVEQYPNVIAVGTTLREVHTALLNDWRTGHVVQGRLFRFTQIRESGIFDRTVAGTALLPRSFSAC